MKNCTTNKINRWHQPIVLTRPINTESVHTFRTRTPKFGIKPCTLGWIWGSEPINCERTEKRRDICEKICRDTLVIKINDSTQRISIIIERPGDPLNFNRHIINGTKLKDLKSVELQPEGCTALTGDNRSILAVGVQFDHFALDKRLKRLKREKDSKQFPTIAIKNRFK